MRTPKITDYQSGEEAKIQQNIIEMLQLKGWFVKSTHGNMYQSGFPDLYATHRMYGARWIEVKKPRDYSFTPAQIRDFPMLCAHGAGVWIMTAATEEQYLCVVKQRPNWACFLNMLNAGG